MIWFLALGYLMLGVVFVFVGPAATGLRKEVRSAMADQRVKKWKAQLFAGALACGVILLWPILVPSAKREAALRKERLGIPANVGGLSDLVALSEAMASIGVDADQLPNGWGEYGLTETNPIPTKAIVGSIDFLERLRSSDGHKIIYERRGSTHSEVAGGMVDIYAINRADGGCFATLFLSPYNRRTSTRPPRGLGIADAVTGKVKFAENKGSRP